MTSAAEFVELDDDELQNRIASARRELLNLRFQLATGQLDNTQRIGEVKKDVARALTVLRARDLYEEDIELEPLVLTPARRVPIDESGGADTDTDLEDDEDADHEGHDHEGHDDEGHDDDEADADEDTDAIASDSADADGDEGDDDTDDEDGD